MFLVDLELKRHKNAVKELPFQIRYILDQYKTQEMCDRRIVEDLFLNAGGIKKKKKISNKPVNNYTHALEFVPNCYKTQKPCNKAVDTYPLTIQFALECYKNKKICDKAANTCLFVFDLVAG